MGFLGSCDCGPCGACVFARKTLHAWKAWNGFDSLKNTFTNTIPFNPCNPADALNNPSNVPECNIRWLKQTAFITWDGNLEGPAAGPIDDVIVHTWPRLSPFVLPSKMETHNGPGHGDALDSACKFNNIDQVLQWDVEILTATEYKVTIEFTTVPGGHFTGTRLVILEEPYTFEDVRSDLVPVLKAIRHEDYPFFFSDRLVIFGTYREDDAIIQWAMPCEQVTLTPPGICDERAARCDPFIITSVHPAAPPDIRQELDDVTVVSGYDAAFIYADDGSLFGNSPCIALAKSVLRISGPYSVNQVGRNSPTNAAVAAACQGNWGGIGADLEYAVRPACDPLLIVEPPASPGIAMRRVRAFSGLKAYYAFSVNQTGFGEIVNGATFNHGPETSLVAGGRQNEAALLQSNNAGITAHLTTDERDSLQFDASEVNLLFWLKVIRSIDADLNTFRCRMVWGGESIELKIASGVIMAASGAVSAQQNFSPLLNQWYFLRLFYRSDRVGFQIDDGPENLSADAHVIPKVATGFLQFRLNSGQLQFPTSAEYLIDEVALFRGKFTPETHAFLFNGGAGRSIVFNRVLFPSWT